MSAHAHGDRSTIEIDLGAIERNWQTGAAACPHARIGCVLKHDAYGLGADRIAPVLAAAGCDDFWVAHLDEAAPLRARLASATARVFALHGLGSHDPDLFAAHRVVPVLASRAEVETARAHAARTGAPLAVAVHLDTGLSRLGLDHDDLIALADRADAFEGLRIECWVTQLVRFEAPGTPETLAQRERFLQWTARLPAADRSIAASGAAFADPLWHLEHVRIGSALYGVRTAATDPPMAPVATLSAPVLRVATVPAGAEVGYGAVFRATRPTVLATLAIGYADGLPYTLGGRGEVRLAGRAVPIVGGVAMGMVGVDVTELPPGSVRTGDRAVLYGPDQPLERLAQAAGVAPNVLLTATASRVPRSYREPSARTREAA